MRSSTDFRIIIVGGGIAGLTLALMLDKFDIDYILLEARKEFAPQVGASIGMMPNGLLILDQLGCYEDIRAKAMNYSFNDMNVRAANGQSMICNKNLIAHLQKRQWLLQVLYEHVQHKDRLLAQHRVSRIDVSASGVQVTADNGKTFSGTIVLGVDGVHSSTRHEMRRIANKIEPGYFPAADENNAACHYQCIFGISKDVPNFPEDEQSMVTGEGHSFLVMSGPGKRVYWFFFNRIPEAKFGDEIPKYSREDELKVVEENRNLAITEQIKFSDLYATRISSTLAPLHEFVFQKWFFHRILLMGDSVHKPNPISAMGGNGAIETVADFMNALLDMRDTRENGLQQLTTQEIATLFAKVQDARNVRASEIITNAHEMQALFALEKPIVSKLILQYMGSYLGPKDLLLKQLAGSVVSGTKVKQLPVPLRPRVMPFDHELPRRSAISKRGAWQRILWTVYTILLLLISIRVTSMVFDRPRDIRDWNSFLQRAWTGRTALYEGLHKATSAARYATSGSHLLPRLRVMYLMSQLISPLLIYTIEGYRAGNFGTVTSFPSLFTGGMLLCGFSGVVPIHAIVSSWNSFTTPVDRSVPTALVKTLVPALTAGYILPTLMMCALPTETRSGLWQFPPLLFSAITACASFMRSWWQRKGQSTAISDESFQLEFECYQNLDVPMLKSVYEYAFAIQATAHMATILYSASIGLPIFNLGFTLPYAFHRNSTMGTPLHMVWDLRRAGYIRTNQTAKASLAIIIANVVFGPGATWAGLWSWRECLCVIWAAVCCGVESWRSFIVHSLFRVWDGIVVPWRLRVYHRGLEECVGQRYTFWKTLPLQNLGAIQVGCRTTVRISGLV
ncbi:FAD binding domain-containing protein [Fusarium pseudocircinatum]|uniref:FAD binding domain-containing protein n=1 Tax=Fusarium pseudocircinatum TaxID=56676 RepID=A0A8H5P2I3_9HYPO|nr:FAD binding domain-containing protein [Fusarium pseudocircinatum]